MNSLQNEDQLFYRDGIYNLPDKWRKVLKNNFNNFHD